MTFDWYNIKRRAMIAHHEQIIITSDHRCNRHSRSRESPKSPDRAGKTGGGNREGVRLPALRTAPIGGRRARTDLRRKLGERRTMESPHAGRGHQALSRPRREQPNPRFFLVPHESHCEWQSSLSSEISFRQNSKIPNRNSIMNLSLTG